MVLPKELVWLEVWQVVYAYRHEPTARADEEVRNETTDVHRRRNLCKGLVVDKNGLYRPQGDKGALFELEERSAIGGGPLGEDQEFEELTLLRRQLPF